MIRSYAPKLLVAFLLLVYCTAFHSGASHGEDVPPESELIATLTSADTPKADKAITCKQIAVFGSAECVDAVAALLPDAELNSWARIALEAIEDPSAEKALLNALSKTEGLSLVGVIHSLGVKRSTDAVEGLTKNLSDENELIAEASASSLGKIGGEDATAALRSALDEGRMSVRSAAAEGLIRCAEQSMAAGDDGASEATKLYDLVLATELPNARIVEATRGAILARGKDGVELLVKSLESDNKRIRYIALTSARELAGDGVSDALLAARTQVPPSEAARYLIALGDRGESSMLAAMLETIKQPADSDAAIDVKTAAIGVVARIGDATCLDALIAAATDGNDVVSAAGRVALENVGDESLNAKIAERAKDAEGKTLETLIGVIGARRIDAIETLVRAAKNDSPAIQTAALNALGDVATIDELSILIDQSFGTSKNKNEVALKALRAACVRMTDKAACVQQLETAMAKSDSVAKLAILEIVAAMGGTDALGAIEKAGLSSDRDLQNAATRLLGGWMTVDAADTLMKISQQKSHAYRIRAVRGYLRLVRQFVMPQNERDRMALAAIDIADRDDEKRLILDAAGRYPSVTMLEIAAQMSENPTLKAESQAAAIAIAQKIKSTPRVQELLGRLDLQEMEIEIIRASYGAEDEQVDVTARLQKQVGKLPIILLDNPAYNSNFGGDPAPGKLKKLRIEYRIDGRDGKAVFDENASIVLPLPE